MHQERQPGQVGGQRRGDQPGAGLIAHEPAAYRSPGSPRASSGATASW